MKNRVRVSDTEIIVDAKTGTSFEILPSSIKITKEGVTAMVAGDKKLAKKHLIELYEQRLKEAKEMLE